MNKLIFPILTMSTIVISCGESDQSKEANSSKEKVTEIEIVEDKIIELDSTSIVQNTYSIYSFQLGDNIIAMSPLPGKVNLIDDIQIILDAGITKMVTLVSQEELESKGLNEYFGMMEAAGIEVYHSPIIDYGLPRLGQVDSIINYMELQKDANENVLIHCMGGYGRSGTIMGCYAKEVLNEANPIEYVRAVRGKDAIETKEQEEFVNTFND